MSKDDPLRMDHAVLAAETQDLPDSESVRQCRICSQILPLTSDIWHRDSHDPQGWQKACKECRKVESKNNEDKKLKAAMERLDSGLLDSIIRDSDASPGVKVPHASIIYESVMDAFGGPQQFAAHLAATYAAASPGSSIREKILRQIITLGVKVTEMGSADEDVSRLTDTELTDKLRKHLLVFTGDEDDAQAAS